MLGYGNSAYGIMTIFIVVMTMGVRLWLQNTYKKWAKTPNTAEITGYEVAKAILSANGLHNVTIERIQGQLSDHYDPRAKVVRLSAHNYDQPSVAGMAVAAHEVGHAIQHARAYKPLEFRAALVPVARFGNGLGIIMIMASVFLNLFSLGVIGLVFFGGAVLFHLVTLPVEFDASRRAAQELDRLGLVMRKDINGVKNVLNAAAMTYVAAAAQALLYLLYYASRLRRN